MGFYHKGYEYDLDESTLRGKACYSIHLRSIEKTQKIKEMYIDVDKATHMPLCIRMKQNKSDWTRVAIMQTKTGQKFSQDLFSFDQKDYPNVEVIDLR